jgi:hypothetical protein
LNRTRAVARLRWTLAAGLAGAAMLSPCHAWEQSRDERAVRAAYVFNLTQYVAWPAPSRELDVAFLGDAGTGDVMAAMLGGRTSAGKSIRVALSPSDDEVRNARVLYVAAARREDVRRALDKVQGRSVLTVGETDEFVREGGMVALVNTGDHIQIEVNLEAAQRAGIRISSRVLNLALIVRSAQNGGN